MGLTSVCRNMEVSQEVSEYSMDSFTGSPLWSHVISGFSIVAMSRVAIILFKL